MTSLARSLAAIGIVAAFAPALIPGSTMTATAAPAELIDTQLVYTSNGVVSLLDRDGRPIASENGYTQPTGTITEQITPSEQLQRMHPFGQPWMQVQEWGPYSDSDWLESQGVTLVSMPDFYIDHFFESLAPMDGEVASTLTYSGDATYRGSTLHRTRLVTGDDRQVAPRGSITATPGNPNSTVTLNLPLDLKDVLRWVVTDTDDGLLVWQGISATCAPYGAWTHFLDETRAATMSGGAGTGIPFQTEWPGEHPPVYLQGGVLTTTCNTAADEGNYVVVFHGDMFAPSPLRGLFASLVFDPATGGSNIGVDPETALAPGQQNIQVVAKGLAANTEYATHRRSAPVRLGTVTANSDGVATFTDALPDDMPDGEHHYTLEDAAGQQVSSVPFTVSVLAPSRTSASFTATVGNDDPGTTDPGNDDPGTGSIDFGS